MQVDRHAAGRACCPIPAARGRYAFDGATRSHTYRSRTAGPVAVWYAADMSDGPPPTYKSQSSGSRRRFSRRRRSLLTDRLFPTAAERPGMASEPVTVATGDGERVTVTGVAYTERDHDGTLRLYNRDDTEIGEFPNARWSTHADHVE